MPNMTENALLGTFFHHRILHDASLIDLDMLLVVQFWAK